MADSHSPQHPAVQPRRAPLVLQIVALAAVIAGLLAGLWIFASPVSRAFADATGVPAYWSSIAFAVIWFVAASVVLGKLRKERPEFRLPLRVGFLLTVAAVGGVFAWTSLTDDAADDDVSFADEAVPASQMPQAEPVPGSPDTPAPPEPPKRNVVRRRARSAASTTPPRAARGSCGWRTASTGWCSPSSTSSARPTCASTWRRTR
jgi:hypothetical protein